MKNDNVITCSGLSKNYGKNIIFDNLSIDIPGGITGLVAPNGYGKTTFIEMCCGLRSTTSGEIKILGKNINNAKEHVGLISDKPIFPPNITVEDYIKIISDLYNVDIDANLLELSGIKKVYKYRIKELSAGYLKRFAFVISMLHEPKLVFADEPFSNVDINAIKSMQSMVQNYNKKGISFIIASHDLKELTDISDRILLIDGQKLKEIKYEKNKNVVEIASSNNDELYDYLKDDFDAIKGENLTVYYDEIKELLLKLSNYSGDIMKIKTIDSKEGLLNEIDHAINKD